MRPSIQELIKRPLLHNDTALEVFNKMTPEELKEWDEHVSEQLIKDGVPNQFPEWNSARLSRDIDLEILYTMIKENTDNE